MTLFDIPAPDDLVESYLVQFFGPAAFLVIAFKLYVLVTSWVGVVSVGRTGLTSASSTARRALAVGWVNGVASIVAVLGAGAILIVWIMLSSTMGYGASYLVHGDIPLSGPRLEPFLSWRHEDQMHDYHIWGSLTVAIFSVLYGFRRRLVGREGELAGVVGFLFTLPWILFGLLMGLYAVIFGVWGTVNWFSDEGFQVDMYGVSVNPAVYAVMTITAFVYAWTAVMVGKTPGMAMSLAGRFVSGRRQDRNDTSGR
ncbi:hypothetical protein [Frankia sp. Cr2]|uniref:hypothetical protein n=1 Tax=Frankia sp. Cr2 TaxID=3073932 RepID=UPI002AD3D990|nr:hypothetical protein [Frankia sp. Cr2]